ncbi:F-box protein CPR1-like [Nicotiana tomentosiformis]|uniref:F-box protein CPR1-like n=1 Tax=Nicotiana tomentosiformis TaxID=4098 RepID=UPI00051BD596|nr:F-box protein CPR1-like [Nicotiana tomentosiformis]
MAGGIIKKLPKDVVINVLIRLPVKSMIRLKCISKALYILIGSTTYTNLHLNRTRTTKDELILFKCSFKEEPQRFKNVLSFLSGVDNGGFNPILPDLDVPYLTTDYGSIFHQLIGPSHGLIALTDSDAIVLLNPTTRHYRLVPPCPFGCPKGYHRTIEGIGFGFVSILNDFKVVRISDVFWDPPYGYPEGRDSKVDVYELSTDSWRELEPVQVPRVYWLPCSEMVYKEAVHWFATIDEVVILCFDIGTEFFRNFKMPGACYFIKQSRYGLIVLNESLSLICYPDPGCAIDPTQDFIHIWIMKEYGISESWIKKYTIKPLPIESPLVVWRDHLLLLQNKTGQLIYYDVNSNEIKEFDLQGFAKSLRVIVYTESLTSIPSGSEPGTQVQKF